MEESTYLTSTMSPKITNKPRKSGKFKGPSVLALKKHFRRSITLDKHFQTDKPNDSVIIVDDKQNDDELIISDSEKDFPIKDVRLLASVEKSIKKNEENRRILLEKLSNSIKPEKSETNFFPKPLKFDNVKELAKTDKKKQIEKWLDDVHNKNNNISLFNDMSMIIGEGMTNVGVANSTVIVPSEKAINNPTKPIINIEKPTEVVEKSITEVSDSFIETKDDDKKSDNDEKDISPEHYEECVQVLDELYGVEWRKDQDKILPKPKSMRTTRKAKIPEENQQASPYFKKQAKPDNLLKTLQKERMKLNLESPNLERLKVPTQFHGMKLNFDENSNSAGKKSNKSCLSGKQSINSESDSDDIYSNLKTVKRHRNKKKFVIDSDSEQDSEKENKNFNIVENSNSFDKKSNKSSLSKKSIKTESDSDDINSNLKTIKKSRNIKKFVIKSDSEEDSEKENENLNIDKDSSAKKQKSKTKLYFDDDDDCFIKDSLENRLKNLKIDDRKISDSEWQSVTDSDDGKFARTSKSDARKAIKTTEKKYSFLASLSDKVPLDQCDFSARIFRTSYAKYRNDLAKKLFNLYNEKVFDNQIPSDTPLEWNDKLIKTSGLCKCRKLRHKNGLISYKASIQLSTKVLNSADRLRDTLIHEMCHAATWIVNNKSDGHGPLWKNWTVKAMRTFEDLPPIKRCHDYEIHTKYTYRCIECGYSFGRHSKSLDTERKRCGHCMGKFEILINKIDKNGEKLMVASTPRKQATPFAQFVKENYKNYKSPALKHGDVMKLLGQKFAEIKMENK